MEVFGGIPDSMVIDSIRESTNNRAEMITQASRHTLSRARVIIVDHYTIRYESILDD
jgi:hypothetical protein